MKTKITEAQSKKRLVYYLTLLVKHYTMRYLLTMLLFCFLFQKTSAQQTSSSGNDSIMITIFLKHQEDKNLDSIQAIQKKNGFPQMFPPASARVVSWYVMMGIGQVVTVKIPASQLRSLNTAIEKGAWGAFNTEFYATYDYMPVWKGEVK